MELVRAASVVTFFILSSVLAGFEAEAKAEPLPLASDETALNEAVSKFQAIAEEIEALARGSADDKADSDTADRIADLRNNLRVLRDRWRFFEPATREAAREAQGDRLTAVDERMALAIAAYSVSPDRDRRIMRFLRETPLASDFLREPPLRSFQGLYRSGFDSSDFYLFDGEGPWWLEPSDEAFEELQTHLVERPGRGSSVTVAVTFTGWIESEGGYGPLKSHKLKVHAERIERIRLITEAEYWTAVGLTRQMAATPPRTR